MLETGGNMDDRPVSVQMSQGEPALFAESMLILLSSTSSEQAYQDLVSLMAQSFPLAAVSLYVADLSERVRVFSALDCDCGGAGDMERVLGNMPSSYQRVVVGGYPPVIQNRVDFPLLSDARGFVILSVNVGNHVQLFSDWTRFLAPAVRKLMEISQLRRLAYKDGLTGVFNHRAFDDMLYAEWERSRRYGDPFALIMLDIDWFKKINDNFGHQIGDMVLTTIGGTIKQSIRKSDIAFRYGGEEFAVIMPNTALEQAGMLAERIRQAVEENDFGDDLSVTVSLGVSHYDDGIAAEEIVSNADRGLYRAKNNGRNRVEVVRGLYEY